MANDRPQETQDAHDEQTRRTELDGADKPDTDSGLSPDDEKAELNALTEDELRALMDHNDNNA